ncbi:MAG TPA: DUF6335 family protein [Vicinamibacterales bacterium]|nr:DUF6335 family protein [Vicinamibacterales bacterium]
MAKKAPRKTARRPATSRRKTGRRPAAARRARGAARKTARPKRSRPARKPKRRARSKTAGAPARRRPAKSTRKTARTASRKTAGTKRRATKRRPARGGRGFERTLAQTPETGRTVKGPTNPMPTIRSTGTPAGAGGTRLAPGLTRERKRLRELDETVPSPPSSLTLDRQASAVRTGRAEMRELREEHTATSPALTGGDVDADWEDAYAVGDEAPGGDNPTPDQDRVDDIGKSVGVDYQDNEELKAADKIARRDKHRWELDPASSEDYKKRT